MNLLSSALLPPALDHPRIALIGAGPANLFLANTLLKKSKNIAIDIFEKEHHPFGFAKYGIAADHVDVRLGTEKIFTTVLSDPRVRLLTDTYVDHRNPPGDWHGSTFICSSDLVNQDVSPYQHVVVGIGGSMVPLSVGELLRRPALNQVRLVDEETWNMTNVGLPLPQEPNSMVLLSVETFVGMLYGHPEISIRRTSLISLMDEICDRLNRLNVCIVGAGNVTLDLIRFFASNRHHHDSALLHQSTRDGFRPRQIHVISRGGWRQMKASVPELSDLLRMREEGVAFRLHGVSSISDEELAKLKRKERRRWTILKELQDTSPEAPRCQVHLHFDSTISSLSPKSNIVDMRTAAGEDRLTNIGLTVWSTGFEANRMKENDPPPEETRKKVPMSYLGWAATGCSGTLADCQQAARELCPKIQKDVQEGMKDPLIQKRLLPAHFDSDHMKSSPLKEWRSQQPEAKDASSIMQDMISQDRTNWFLKKLTI